MPRPSFTSMNTSGTNQASNRANRNSQTTSGCALNQKYGSVKYNRVSSMPAKEDVHETLSNPSVSLSTPLVVAVDDADDRVNPNPMDIRGVSDPDPPNPIVTLDASQTSRQKHLSLLPPSLHISFDVEPDQNRPQHINVCMPLSQSSDNVRHYQRFGSVGSTGTNGTIRPRQAGQRRNFLQQSEIAQISAGYMRANGAVQQFRRILAAPEKSPNFLSKVLHKQHSKEKDKEESSTATLHKHQNSTNLIIHASMDDSKTVGTTQTQTSTTDGETPKCPIMNSFSNGGQSALSGANNVETADEHSDAFKLPACPVYKRHELFDQRRKACDYSCLFAILGIILMIMENEFTAHEFYTKSSPYSYCLKSLIVLSTLILLMLILAYHALELQLWMTDLGCYDWRILINTKRVVQISLELLACSVCPIPGDFQFAWYTVHHDGKTVTSAPVPVDVLLSIPMFLRLYLLCRLMLLHSKLFTDAPSRSIGAMSGVKFSARFVLKTLMTMSPGTVLLTFTASFWTTAAWIMLLCERHHGFSSAHSAGNTNSTTMHYEAIKHQNYFNSLWLVAITSLTIGYGDIVPNTYCGRAVSVICGIMGAGTSSLVVAVVARKLELSGAEKYVHTFMMDSSLTKKLKHAAANVLRETWLIYKYRKLAEKMDASKIRYHQRKFLIAIYEMRRIKRGQRKLDESSMTILDLVKMTSRMYEKIDRMQTWQQEIEEKMSGMDQRCANVEAYMRQLQISIRVLPELVARKLHPSSSAASAMAFKPNSQATSICDSHPPSAAQSTDAHNGSGYSTPE